MILFFTSGQGGPWYVPAIFIILSVFIQGGWFSLSPFSFLFGFPFPFTTFTYSSNGWQRSQHLPQAGPSWALLTCLAIAVVASLFICRFFTQLSGHIQRHGFWHTVQSFRETPWQRWPTLLNNAAGAHDRARNQQRAGPNQQARFEKVSQCVQQLPTELFMSRQDLEALRVHDLKEKLKQLGVVLRHGESIDQSEAIALAQEIGGSSSISCGICCEDYESKDVLRRLPKCGHRFHLECVDRWLLSSADYSRPSACPMCNTPL